jgi:hypothetical protein
VRDFEAIRKEQHEGIEFLEDTPFAGLFADVGMGKSVMSQTVAARHIQRHRGEKVLIWAPRRVAIQSWPTSLGEWRHTAHIPWTLLRVPEKHPAVLEVGSEIYQESRDAGFTLEGARARRGRWETLEAERQRRLLTESDAPIHIIDRHAFPWLVDTWARRGEWPYTMIIGDEASVLGEAKNEIFQCMLEVRSILRRLVLLTATPATQSPMKWFAITAMLDGGKRFGKRITPFRERYFTYNQYSREFKIRPGAEDEILRKIADIVKVMEKKRSADEKPLIVRRRVVLPPETLEAYRAFEESSVLELPSGAIAADSAAGLSNKLIQAASGAVYDENRKPQHFHDEKIEDLRELIEELQGQPLLVAYWFKSSLDRLLKAFPKAKVMDPDGKLVDEWNKKRVPLLFQHPMSAGEGLNQQFGGHHLDIFDQFWPLDRFLQIIGRLDRDGQKHRVIVHQQVTEGTHDEAVASRLGELGDARDAMRARLMALRARLGRY